ncbi:TetR family transcriptional regulator [Streptomyces sp. WAC 06738]|uniref:ScbR family autoregulator-binding transcription factor n=1 Tax=Streptomyces sp. WAC 06738 TaxID=2203210 RepID=UPI000F70EB23|nr:ScbR family autoregulator-binding transcription factor [Streptomyces sp. WAC 06738]AZM49758.1 TetR family transcriptional regulator [Streptomyces sp. WAC 06738]
MARQERAIRTRAQILTAAASVFGERGYEAATVSEILARAGVTKGALYFHFPSKRALAEGVLAEQLNDIDTPAREYRTQEVIDTGLALAYRVRRDPVISARAWLSLGQEMQRLFGGGVIPAWLAETRRLLEQAKEEGELLPHITPAETAWVVSACWTGVQVYSATLSNGDDLEEKVSLLFAHLLPFIAVPDVLGKLDYRAERAGEVVAEMDRRYAELAAREAAGDTGAVQRLRGRGDAGEPGGSLAAGA